MSKRILTVILIYLIVITVPFTAFCSEINTPDGVRTTVEGVISYKCKCLNVDSTGEMLTALSSSAGKTSSDWYYIALAQYGVDCKNEKSISALKNVVDDFYKKGLANVKATDLQRVAFALTACGQDITDINGHNLLADATYNRSKYRTLDAQGANSLAYALLLLDSKNYIIPSEAMDTRESIISKILEKEAEKGGYVLMGNSADTDTTAIVLQALAPYKTKEKVRASIDRCLNILSVRQDENGAYKSFSNTVTSETTSQVIIALTSLNIDPIADSRFIKNENTILDGLMNFKLESGAFCHTVGASANDMATYQSFCALVSVHRFFNNNGAFYDFNLKLKSEIKSVNKSITKSTAKRNSEKTPKSSKISSRKTTENKRNNSIIENKTEASKITEKNKTNSKDKQKIKTAVVEFKTNATETTKSSVKTVNSSNTDIPENPQPFYINSVLLVISYIILFSMKKGGKK